MRDPELCKICIEASLIDFKYEFHWSLILDLSWTCFIGFRNEVELDLRIHIMNYELIIYI